MTRRRAWRRRGSGIVRAYNSRVRCWGRSANISRGAPEWGAAGGGAQPTPGVRSATRAKHRVTPRLELGTRRPLRERRALRHAIAHLEEQLCILHGTREIPVRLDLVRHLVIIDVRI